MSIALCPFYSKPLIRAHLDKIFVFGDNLAHRGCGGQAAACRGEPNTIGIPTKVKPSMSDDSFFSDDKFGQYRREIDLPLLEITKYAFENMVVVFPEAGLGTGRAQLQTRAPGLYSYLNNRIELLKADFGIVDVDWNTK